MTKVVVIADDLTGANATCALLKKTGLRAASILSQTEEIPQALDVVAIPTNSRAVEPEEAERRVRSALEHIKSGVNGDEVKLFNKRVDSTLRGNVSDEINAFFDVLGDERMGIVVPAFPQTGRIVLHGTMLVNGQLLIHSDAGRDTKTPVFTSNAIERVTEHCRQKSAAVWLEEVEGDVEALIRNIQEVYQRGVRLLFFDAITDAHLQTIARAVLQSGVPFFTIDPGPFTLAVTRMQLDQEQNLSRVLMVVGSVTELSTRQLNAVIEAWHPAIIAVDAERLVDPKTYLEEIVRCINLASAATHGSELVLVTSTPLGETKRIDLGACAAAMGRTIEEAAGDIAKGLAVVASEVLLKDEEFAGVFLSGGDITVAFCEVTGASGVEISEEVLPLVAYGRVVGGKLDRLRLISKGGMAGEEDTMLECVKRLRGLSKEM